MCDCRSIADNRLGGWYSYRISKAALNQAKDNQKSATSLHRTSTKKEETVEQLLAKLQKKGQKVQLVDDSQEKKLEEERRQRESETARKHAEREAMRQVAAEEARGSSSRS